MNFNLKYWNKGTKEHKDDHCTGARDFIRSATAVGIISKFEI